ncbi:DEAD/DEAH box helicase [Streptomyces glaucosporus]|uniref:DEAD/DEAH box helicase n=1 Tax=Streptomyces glaucosporus TaxID=284044 RepID=A0ABP5VQJ8_9ACTN
MADTSAARNTPVPGLYEQLVTDRLEERLRALRDGEWHAFEKRVGEQSSPHVLARHIAEAAYRVLAELPHEDRVAEANRILDVLGAREGVQELVERVAEGPRQLVAVVRQEARGVYELPRPATPLSDTALLTNAPEDPSLGHELRAELATADRVDLLCAFVKWHGLRVLEDSLRQAAERGVPIRVVTTTYIGATERHALDRLVREFGAEVKVNYELRSTRLHAKAWLFRRRSGFDTAYVGSSNLSKAALLDGLEWNVRLSSVATPAVLRKFEATFDSYWNDPAFESYDPDRDAEQLDDALLQAGGGVPKGEAHGISLSGLEVRPYPHQQDMLERLRIEREVHDRRRNLLVAATGTGKTVMAALDYRSLRRELGRDLTLLFVAHRQEILKQSLRTYQDVLIDGNFGELFVGGTIPRDWRHVFASVQSLSKASSLERLAPDHFDVIVIDEFHHATAATYRRVIDHFKPVELLGLTATPERMDGRNVQDEFFDGRIAAEMRLWEALENDLLSPFHYFGIADGTDLESVTWKRGSYDTGELDNLFTGNHARARLVVKAVEEKVADPRRMKALGFCVSVRHAHFMAECFRQAGIDAVAVDGSTPAPDRARALADLRDGRVQAVFSVDLFNEGVDIPDVDTLLLLRPTASATVFLQQLGRGLRRTPDKAVLTVLDFIGQHRREFRFEPQFRALTNLGRTRLLRHMEEDFPQLPSGCQIVLDRQSKERILANIKSNIKVNSARLAGEVASYAEPRLAAYLRESGRELRELYRNNGSWTGLLRRARLLAGAAPEGEDGLLKRASVFLHADDPKRVDAYTRLLGDDAPGYASLSPADQAYARMLFFTLWPDGGGFGSYAEGLESLRGQHAFRDEVRQILAYNLEHTEHYPIPLSGVHADLPLTVHAYYNREEILTALGQVDVNGSKPVNFREGVRWCENLRTDALLITLEKDEKDFSPQTRYKDYALSRDHFHWESQVSTSETSPVGQRYQRHKELGSHVLLFARRFKTTETGPGPWMLLGPAEYVSHKGSRPMGIVWKLAHDLPADVWTYTAVTRGA